MSYGRDRSRERDVRRRDHREYREDDDRGYSRSVSSYRSSYGRSQSYRRSASPPRGGRYDRPRRPPPHNRDDGFIRVAGIDLHKETAGRIADIARHGPQPPTLLAIGHPCLYNAVQAIATARQYVLNTADRNIGVFDLTCQPAFREHVEQRDRHVKPSLALYLTRAHPEEALRSRSSGPPVELSVSGTGDPPVVAGALAARVREGADVCITAIGADAVAIGLRAICHARVFLERDDLDIKCLPESVIVFKEERELRAIRFNVLMEKLR